MQRPQRVQSAPRTVKISAISFFAFCFVFFKTCGTIHTSMQTLQLSQVFLFHEILKIFVCPQINS